MVKLRAVSEKIELWPIENLKPYDKNPKLHPQEQIDKICKSIRTFGFINPLLVHSDLGIVGGHGRLQAALKLKLSHLPVIMVDHLSIEDATAYLLADNKLGEGYGYDDKLLAEIMTDLDSTAYDLSLTGYSEKEISSIMDDDFDVDGEDEIKVSEVKKDKDVFLSFDKFKFSIKQGRFEKWMSEIGKADPEDKESIAREIIRRLGL